jgi:hypothetical protein
VLCQVLVLAHHHGIDLVDEVQRKWLVHSDAATRSEPSTHTAAVTVQHNDVGRSTRPISG